MTNELILSITNRIARLGIDAELEDLLIDLLDTILAVKNLNDISITNLQTLLLLICKEKLPMRVERLVEETRLRLIRNSLGEYWLHGDLVTSQIVSTKNRQITNYEEKLDIYASGLVVSSPLRNIQPELDLENNILNDLAVLTFGEE